MAHRKKKRKPKNSNAQNLKTTATKNPKSVERDIEKFKFYSVIVHTLGSIVISFKDQILKWFS